MKRSTVLHLGPDRLRAGSWRGDDRTALLSPLFPGTSPRPESVTAAVERLADTGYRCIITTALNPTEQRGFLEAGFEVREHLHLLVHDLAELPDERMRSVRVGGGAPPQHRPRVAVRIHRARRRDRPAVLRIDQAAFEPFWRFDADGLHDALTATPVSRFRTVRFDHVVGYAVTGRSHDQGYLQRLAVDPEQQGKGFGRALVLDSLSWLRRRGAIRAMVNTQESNHTALHLYETLGFQLQADGLDVLVLDLDGSRR